MEKIIPVILYLFLAVVVVGIAGRLLRKTERGEGVFVSKREQILNVASLSSLDHTVVYFAVFRLEDGTEVDLKVREWVYGALKEGAVYDLTWKGMTLKTIDGDFSPAEEPETGGQPEEASAEEPETGGQPEEASEDSETK